jgi:hypothetical protein
MDFPLPWQGIKALSKGKSKEHYILHISSDYVNKTSTSLAFHAALIYN